MMDVNIWINGPDGRQKIAEMKDANHAELTYAKGRGTATGELRKAILQARQGDEGTIGTVFELEIDGVMLHDCVIENAPAYVVTPPDSRAMFVAEVEFSYKHD